MSASPAITIAALAIVRTSEDQVVFVRQARGPYAGSWLLPGGKLEFGEAAEDAARRETLEEAGFAVAELTPTGVYEIRGEGYHFVMFAFLAAGDPARVADGGHHVDGVIEAPADAVSPHPTVRRILNESGVGAYGLDTVEADLRRDGITMRSFPVGAPAAAAR